MSVSLGLPGSLSQGSYTLSLEAFQIKHLYIRVISPKYYPLTTLDTANACTILVSYILIK